MKAAANKGSTRNCRSCGNGHDQTDRSHDPTIDHVVSTRQDDMPRANVTGSKAMGAAPVSVNFEKTLGADTIGRPNAVRSENGPAIFLGLGAAILGVIAVGLLILSFTIDITKHAKIIDRSWSRAVPILAIVPVREDGWNVPNGAYEVTSTSRVKSYRDVLIGYHSELRRGTKTVSDGTEQYSCGQESLGNGYFRTKTCTRQKTKTVPTTETVSVPDYDHVPVYAPWYSYTVKREQVVRTLYASGQDLSPKWPEVHLAAGEREGHRLGDYRISFALDGETKVKRMSEHEWSALASRDAVDLVSDFWGNIKSVSN